MTKAAAHLESMHNMLARGDVGEAEAAAHAALTVDPDAIDAHALLGKIAAHRGDHAAALRHLDRAADHGAVDPDLAAAYGVALVRAGRYDDAIAPFRIASEGGRYPLDNLLRLGWVYERLERFDALRKRWRGPGRSRRRAIGISPFAKPYCCRARRSGAKRCERSTTPRRSTARTGLPADGYGTAPVAIARRGAISSRESAKSRGRGISPIQRRR